MNVQRFLAPTSREAMNKVKASLGDAAVILSTRTTEDGFEVLAMTEEGLRALPGMDDGTPAARAPQPAAAPQAPSRLQQRAADQLPAPQAFSASSSVAQDTETLAMSTLSFQDYVRERMLAKRRDMLQGEAAGQAPRATVQRAAAPQPSAPMAAPYHAPAFDTLPERANPVGRSAAAVPAMPMGSDDIV